jgi:hypothetical protein
MKIQLINLQINDTCLVSKTRHGQYQETGPLMDQDRNLLETDCCHKQEVKDSTHFTLNWSLVERNPE